MTKKKQRHKFLQTLKLQQYVKEKLRCEYLDISNREYVEDLIKRERALVDAQINGAEEAAEILEKDVANLKQGLAGKCQADLGEHFEYDQEFLLEDARKHL